MHYSLFLINSLFLPYLIT